VHEFLQVSAGSFRRQLPDVLDEFPENNTVAWATSDNWAGSNNRGSNTQSSVARLQRWCIGTSRGYRKAKAVNHFLDSLLALLLVAMEQGIGSKSLPAMSFVSEVHCQRIPRRYAATVSPGNIVGNFL
jgi:hypothetical protein